MWSCLILYHLMIQEARAAAAKNFERGLKQVYKRAWVPACFISCLPHAQELLPYHLPGVGAEFAVATAYRLEGVSRKCMWHLKAM